MLVDFLVGWLEEGAGWFGLEEGFLGLEVRFVCSVCLFGLDGWLTGWLILDR